MTLLIVLTGIVLIWLIFKTEPTATQKDSAQESAMLVDVQTVARGTHRPTIEVMGQVVPAREVTLRSRVGGQVIEQAERFDPGQRVEKGALLLKLEPADYQSAVEQRESELQQALAELDLEQGQQAVARQEFELLGEEIAAENRSLVLRKPQLKQAQASVASARAALRQAELDLQRTRVHAPFPAQILARDVTLGSEVSAGDTLGRLVGTEQYWVDATVPLSKLRWLSLADKPGAKQTTVSLYQDTVWPDGESRQGVLTQLVGELDSKARMARVLITVDDPLAQDEAEGEPPLILNSFIRAEIEGRPLDNVVRLQRHLVRRNQTVWVMEDRKLEVRDVEIAFQDEDYAYIESGLEGGDRVITNNLSSVVSGARLRLEDDSQ